MMLKICWKRNKFFLACILSGFLLVLFFPPQIKSDQRIIQWVKVEGTISPATLEYIKRSFMHAQAQNIECLVIQIDTPGGLDSSMREIVKLIMNANFPVVVYVAPGGARAASAGVFIALSAHILAMAPGTNIGAAHPVSLMGGMDEEMKEKVVNDAAAYIRSIAQKRGRNVEWAEKTVRESISVSAQEALHLNIADFLAEDENELLEKLDGTRVAVDGKEVTLRTANVKVDFFEPDFKDRFLQRLADPNLAYILLMIGIWGIILEFFNPGIFLPGIAGAICLILAFFSLQLLPFNVAGILLIVLAVVLFILEIEVPSYGALTIGGVVALTIGSFMLIDPSAIYISIDWRYILAGVGVTLFLFIFIIFYAIKAQLKKPVTGPEGMVGTIGIAKTNLNPRGKVYVYGELWNAVSFFPDEIIQEGEEVEVARIEGMKIFVKRKEG